MNIGEINDRIAEIKRVGVDVGDAETAHSLEDVLREDFIEFLASDPRELAAAPEMARVIARTTELNFARWCA